MRQRKKEMDAIAEILESEHHDVDELATEIWKLVDGFRREREMWVVAARHAGGVNFLYGPYESENTARKDITAGSIRFIDKDDKFMLMKLLSPSTIFVDIEPQTLFDIR